MDKEKVIRGLWCLAQKQESTANPCKDCGYINRPNFAMCVVDVATDALKLLNEQEPVKPIRMEHWWKCSLCGGNIVANMKHCPRCGREVKWDG